MKIFNSVETVDGLPAIFLKKEGILAISDTHLGYELYLAEKGMYIPQLQLKEMLQNLKEAYELTGARTLLINGDMKHEFGEASRQEWREVREFVTFAKKMFEEVVLVRGNHDNYLLSITSKLGIEVFDPFYLRNGKCFLHGHKKVKLPWEEIEILIIGHEQPALLLRRGFDKIKIPCILYGKMKNGKRIICIPSFSPLSSGTSINMMDKDELLSPYLREEVDLMEMEVIGIDKEVGALKFPKLKKIIGDEDEK